MFQRETFRARRKFHPPAPVRHARPAGGGRDRGRRAGEALRRLPGRPGAHRSGSSRARCSAWSGPNGAGQDDDDPEHRRDHHPDRGPDPDRRARPGHGRRSRPSRCSPSSPTSRTCSTTSPSRSTSASSAGSTRWPTSTRGSPACSRSSSWPTSAPPCPGELSRGMKQKLAIACGLLHEPAALLLDEPLTGLDPVGIRRMKATIVRRAEAGAAVILSSHLLHLVEEICTRVLVMNRGQAVALRHHRRDRREPAGAARPPAGGRVPGAHHARGRSRGSDPGLRLPGLALGTYNRVARQLRQLRSPRYLAALVLGLSLPLDRVGGAAARPATRRSVVGARWLELHGRDRRGRRGAVGLGVRRRAPRARLQSRRGDLPLLGTGDAARTGAVQAAAEPARSSCSTRCSGR